LLSAGGFFQPFTMQMHHAPFNDVRVRQAFRLLVDREEMLRQVFAGHGTIGNDLFGIWDPAYNHSLSQRVADAEQAKSLLKQAGHDGLTVELITSDFASGLVQSAQVLAQQASAAGVKVNLRQVTPTELYGPNYKSWTFAQDAWDYYPYIPDVLQGMVPNAPFNECGAGDPAYLNLLKQALAELNPTKRADIIHEMQQREYDGVSSGYIIPYFPATIDGYATKVNGLRPSRTGLPLGGYELKRVWLS
jgi:peptide/nickel transport system substrate-binding protein